MGASESKSSSGIGFLTVVEDEEQGFLGGYLVLNASSRPLEFHCTAPVKPNRAQQILYGPTLAPYICGEQIGTALAKKSSVEAAVIFTDMPAMMAVRPLVNSPVVLVPSGGVELSNGVKVRFDEAHAGAAAPHHQAMIDFQIADRRLSVGAAFAGDQQRVTALLDDGACIDFDEPFERIREAIEETQLRKR